MSTLFRTFSVPTFPFGSAVGFIATAVALIPRLATAQDVKSYTTKAGDTCESISKRFYDDERFTDVLHGANPKIFTKPPPHHLDPGLVLVVPPKPASATGPDARLNFVRRKVELETPAPKEGQVNDPLFRGNRVNTLEASSAKVLFRDESQIQMSEHTLIVILGDINAAAAKQATSADVSLVTGNLVARLAQASKKTLRTEAAEVKMSNTEARVSVDEKKTTRVAVYRGTSELTAQKKSVTVPDGFGSKAEKGKAPTEPKPLPDAPVWSLVAPALRLIDAGEDATLAWTYRANSSTPGSWHLQLARDEGFDDLLVDARVPASVTELSLPHVAPGKYFARVAAVDEDQFEGKPSSVATSVVASLKRTTDEKSFTLELTSPVPLTCASDGKTLAIQGAGKMGVFSRLSPHELRCSLAESPSTDVAATRNFAADVAPAPTSFTAQAMWMRKNRMAHEGTVLVRARDREGKPVAQFTVRAKNAIIEETTTPAVGEALVRLRWDSISELSLEVVGAETFRTALPPLPLVDVEREELETGGAECAIAPGFGFVNEGLAQTGVRLTGSCGYRFAMKSGALVVAGELGFETFPAVDLAADPSTTFEIEQRSAVFGIPLSYRFLPHTKSFVPYLSLTPQLLLQTSELTEAAEGASAPSFRTTKKSTPLLGLAGKLGAMFRIGPGGFFVESGYRGVTRDSYDRRIARPSGILFDLGYRFQF